VLSKHNFNIIHGPDDDSPEDTHTDDADSRMLMEWNLASLTIDIDKLETEKKACSGLNFTVPVSVNCSELWVIFDAVNW